MSIPLKKKQNEYACSPVIGVSLMVAITVILAVVIMSISFGLVGSHLQTKKAVAVSVKQIPNNNIECIYLGGTDDPLLEYIVIIDPSGNSFWTTSANGDLLPEGVGTPQKPSVGAVMTVGGATNGRGDHIIVIGHFNDGALLVIADNWV